MPKDLKDMSMEELIAHYNEIAEANGKEGTKGFTSLDKGRKAVVKLERSLQPAKANTGATVRGPNTGVGAFAKERLLDGMSNKDALAATLAAHPAAKTTLACIAYYRTKLTAAGKLASSRTAKPAEAPAEEEAGQGN